MWNLFDVTAAIVYKWLMAAKTPQKGVLPRMRRLAFRVEESLAKTLKVLAAQADISMARYIEQVLKDHVKGEKKR